MRFSESSANPRISMSKKKRTLIKFKTLLFFLIGIAFVLGYFSIRFSLKSIASQEIESEDIRTPNAPFPNVFIENNVHSVVKDEVNIEVGNEEKSQQKEHPILTAYAESTDFSLWDQKPFPVRTTDAYDLKKIPFPQLDSCSKLPSQWPVDNFPDEDPFLPWIHDVFPSSDGHFIRFVAQNKRRCNTGKQMGKIKKQMQPQLALFQTVPIKRISNSPTRYRLSSYEEADEDGLETRFICRFKPSMQETLSTFPVNYDYHTMRKGYKSTFTEEGFDNHIIWTSQLMIDCPVPPELQKVVRDGSSVIDDYATMFVDLIPIRTPVRYDGPTRFLPPRFQKDTTFKPDEEWGTDHILPLIENSGRWENIPICKTSLQTYGMDEEPEIPVQKDLSNQAIGNTIFDLIKPQEVSPFSTSLYQPQKKIHHLIGCTWTSASFATRGDRAVVSDGERRLFEWLSFHLSSGFDHIYIYDNTGAFTDAGSLKAVTDSFPGRVTRIDWPSKVCNNRPNNVDNKGERSSQYAAETSCRLRFGAHSEWLGAMDTDEYLVPKGFYTNMKDLLNDVDGEQINILSFNSQRAKPRFDLLLPPYIETKHKGFDPKVSNNVTFFQTYNCHREWPRKDFVPAEKQIYKPDYVLLHHIHYSTITVISQLSESQTKKIGKSWRHRYKEAHVRFIDEYDEGLMLHTKSVVFDQTKHFQNYCSAEDKHLNSHCKLGFPWPKGEVSKTNVKDGNGYVFNCFVDEEIENFWLPKLKEAMVKYGKIYFENKEKN